MRRACPHNKSEPKAFARLHQPPRVGHEVLGVLVVDGGELSLGGRLREEGVDEETAEDIQGAVQVSRVNVEVIVGVLVEVDTRVNHKTIMD